MKGLVWVSPRRVELRDLPTFRIRSDQVLLKVRAAAICGSDKEAFLDTTPPVLSETQAPSGDRLQ
jgi:threonine dehydrogenase-like Zn-dependent dehydrogenase